jgi:hypothetical protein
MSDPSKTTKGGFGAFVAMDRARRAARAAESETAAANTAASTTGSPSAANGATSPEPGLHPSNADRADKTTTRPADGG